MIFKPESGNELVIALIPGVVRCVTFSYFKYVSILYQFFFFTARPFPGSLHPSRFLRSISDRNHGDECVLQIMQSLGGGEADISQYLPEAVFSHNETASITWVLFWDDQGHLSSNQHNEGSKRPH
jgi:hypothetical protein